MIGLLSAHSQHYLRDSTQLPRAHQQLGDQAWDVDGDLGGTSVHGGHVQEEGE